MAHPNTTKRSYKGKLKLNFTFKKIASKINNDNFKELYSIRCNMNSTASSGNSALGVLNSSFNSLQTELRSNKKSLVQPVQPIVNLKTFIAKLNSIF